MRTQSRAGKVGVDVSSMQWVKEGGGREGAGRITRFLPGASGCVMVPVTGMGNFGWGGGEMVPVWGMLNFKVPLGCGGRFQGDH